MILNFQNLVTKTILKKLILMRGNLSQDNQIIMIFQKINKLKIMNLMNTQKISRRIIWSNLNKIIKSNYSKIKKNSMVGLNLFKEIWLNNRETNSTVIFPMDSYLFQILILQKHLKMI